MVVDNWLLSIKACQLSTELKSLTAKAKVIAILHWVKWHCFLWVRNIRVLKHPPESHKLASNFVFDARQALAGSNMHHDCILDMDQTLIQFSLHWKWSFDSLGNCTVDICKLAVNTRHATLAVMVTVPGRMFPPFFIFKGRLGG